MLLIYFLDIFWLFFIIKFVFLSFSFLFLIKYQISATAYNQSETWIGGFEMSVELYATLFHKSKFKM